MAAGDKIGLISSVPFESKLLLGKLKGARKPSSDKTTGTVFGKKVVHITSGIGTANAARAATVLIERYKPGFIVLFGIGGAYPKSGLRVGDLALAERETYADTGILIEEGLIDLEAAGLPLLERGRRKYYSEFPLDRGLLKKSLRALEGMGVRSGVFLTVSQCTGTTERALKLEARHGAICENMEGAAVAQTCASYGCGMVELRGISNLVENRDLKKWDKGLSSENCQRALLEIIRLA